MPGETVTVGCKLPHGILLQLQEKRKEREPVMGGGFREVERSVKIGRMVRLNGCAVPQDAPNNGVPIAHGCALTHGVDKDFWDKWLSQNQEYEPVKNRMIFAAERPANVEAQAKEMTPHVSGFERTDPKNPPAEFRRKGSEIQPAKVA